MEQKLIEIKGKKYQYLDTEIGNPAILFIHGLGSNKDIMPQIFSDFIDGYRCIFLDLPAHNKIPDYNFKNLEDFADYIINFIEGIHLNNFHIVGFSFGGLVAIQTQKQLKKHKVECKAVAWASPLKKSYLTLRARVFLELVDKINNKFYKRMPSSSYFKLLVALLGIKARNKELESFKNFENDLLDRFASMIPSKLINTDNQEILYIFGTKDPLISDSAFKQTKIDKNCQSKLLVKKGGHYYTKEGRKEATNKIFEFLKS